MIRLGDLELDLSIPAVQAALAAALFAVAVLVLLALALRAAARSARATEPLAQNLIVLGQNVQHLALGQEQLRGSLQTVSDTTAGAQAKTLQTMEARLASVQTHMQERLSEHMLRGQRDMAELQVKVKETLHGSGKATASSLGALQERLAVIDKAQDNITKLSSDVIGLQDILSNKQTRGAFGEIQLHDIVSKSLPAGSYSWQHTLSTGKRCDCLLLLPNPPGPIAIDSKFPLEAYEALRAASSEPELKRAASQMRASVRKHIADIADKYILDGETADGALLFVPSEAVYSELHGNFPDLVRDSFERRVWIVSPTTCMATLNTMRAILKDARMREQAGAIRRELALLAKDLDRLGERVGNLDRHFGQAARDIEEIRTSSDKAGRRARRLDTFEFEDAAPDAPRLVQVAASGTYRRGDDVEKK